MNKRIRKKRFKNYHKRFCHPSDKRYSWQCPKCGWDSLEADENCSLGRILWQRGGFTDYEFEIEYKCPVCGTIFSYVDGA